MNIYKTIAQEGNRKEFVYKGFDCLIKRNREQALCGYVCIDNTHLILNYTDDIYDNIDVHGGLTYGGFIGHKQYLGFDCAHWGDFTIFSAQIQYSEGTYRTMEYVEKEIKSLVDQLIGLDV